MKALITGGAGFIGSHLAEELLHRGDEVTVVDDLSTGSIDNIAPLLDSDKLRFVRDTVRNTATMTALIDGCDVVYHLAAAVGVKLIIDSPVRTIETNIHGSEVVLALANKFGRKVLVASTSEVYGKNTETPFSEDDDSTLGSTRYSRWSYACSKMVEEFLALAYRDQFGLDVVVCRVFNTIGPRQCGQYGMVVPRFVRSALVCDPVEVYGTGKQSRCFCHVRDVTRAMIALSDSPAAAGEVVNVGSAESITIDSLADKITEMTGSDSKKVYVTYEQAYGKEVDDMLVRMPDLTKIERLISYQPQYSLDDTLAEIVEYERPRLEKTGPV